MDIEDYIEKIIDNGKIQDMEELSEMLEEAMEIIKQYDEECFEEFQMKLYKMAYGSKLNREMAEKIVEQMRPYGMRWTYEETTKLQREKGLEYIDSPSFFTVINSAYNDYNDLFGEDEESYIRFTIDFIQDEDGKENKVFKYFVE